MGDTQSKLRFEQSPQQNWLWSNVSQPLWSNMMSNQMPPLYDLPSPVLPTQGWWSGMDPTLKAGMMEPYKQGFGQMADVMGMGGQTGVPGAPSGAFGEAAADYTTKAMGQIANQAWGMYYPGASMAYQAELGKNMTGYQQSMLPYNYLNQATNMAMPYPTVQQGGLAPWMNLAGMGLMGWGMGGFPMPW